MLEGYGLGVVELKFTLRKPEYKIRVFYLRASRMVLNHLGSDGCENRLY